MFLLGCKKDKADVLYPTTNNCDTINVTYSNQVAPILTKNCAFSGCHNTATKSAGYAYDSYSETKVSVTNNALIGSIKHLSGFSSMPKGGVKLSNCDINKIQAWINQGALDN
jgi:hypothetical protein